MAKVAVTAVKYTESHDRMTITAKFADGSKLRIGSGRYSGSISCSVTGINLQNLSKQVFGKLGTGETNGDRFRAIAAALQLCNSAVEGVAITV